MRLCDCASHEVYDIWGSWSWRNFMRRLYRRELAKAEAEADTGRWRGEIFIRSIASARSEWQG